MDTQRGGPLVPWLLQWPIKRVYAMGIFLSLNSVLLAAPVISQHNGSPHHLESTPLPIAQAAGF